MELSYKKMKAHAVLIASHTGIFTIEGQQVLIVPKQESKQDNRRQCIQCGKLKTHNNAFCSALCRFE